MSDISVAVDQITDLVWELEVVCLIITIDELDISLGLPLLRASIELHSDTVNISLSSRTITAMRMMILEMRILMRVGVSYEMMMIDSQEMYQRYSQDQY